MKQTLGMMLIAILSATSAFAQQTSWSQHATVESVQVRQDFPDPAQLAEGTIAGKVAEGMLKAEIENVLRTQQAAWNRHDLDAFMSGYWNSPDLTFFSDAKETSGWQATLDRYKAAYASPGHEMGKLEFSDLRIEMLGPEAAFVRGAWHLTMSDGKIPHGRFTLIFRKFPEGWKIIHDHTSAAKD